MDMSPDDSPATKSDFKAFRDELILAFGIVRVDIAGLRTDVTALQGDVTGLRTDVTALQVGLAEVRDGLAEVRGGLASAQGGILGLQNELRETRRGLALEIVKTHGRIDQLRDDLRGEMKIQVSVIFKKIDGFMSKVGKVDRAQIIADWRVGQLEKRVDKVESRPS